MRTVVLHHHLFKNAGTSLDTTFKQQFGDLWVTKEFPGDRAANAEGLARWITNRPRKVVFSTHTGRLPAPKLEGVEVIPVIFVRHPIDRIASAYRFETTQANDGFGATLARNTTLAGYIETRLSIPEDRQCRDFHTTRLADQFDDDRPEVDRALAALDVLPFVGLVEEYDASLARLQDVLADHGLTAQLTSVHANVSRRPEHDLTDRLAQIEAEVGPAVWERLLAANAGDLAVHEAVVARYSPSPNPTPSRWKRLLGR